MSGDFKIKYSLVLGGGAKFKNDAKKGEPSLPHKTAAKPLKLLNYWRFKIKRRTWGMDGDVSMSGRAHTAKIALMLAMAFFGSVTTFAVASPSDWL